MLFASPNDGFTASLTCVICVHEPIGPAHTSGACRNDCRTTADVRPSVAKDAPYSPHPPSEISSGPDQTGVTFALLTSRVASPISPSTISLNRILSPDCQCSPLGEALIPGVTFFAVPPPAGMIKMSPPVEPSSLMIPEIKAMFLPSGDQRGTAICKGGL